MVETNLLPTAAGNWMGMGNSDNNGIDIGVVEKINSSVVLLLLFEESANLDGGRTISATAVEASGSELRIGAKTITSAAAAAEETADASIFKKFLSILSFHFCHFVLNVNSTGVI